MAILFPFTPLIIIFPELIGKTYRFLVLILLHFPLGRGKEENRWTMQKKGLSYSSFSYPPHWRYSSPFSRLPRQFPDRNTPLGYIGSRGWNVLTSHLPFTQKVWGWRNTDMAKYRKTHLLFFLLTIIPMQFIFPPTSSPGDYIPLSCGPDDHEHACYRTNIHLGKSFPYRYSPPMAQSIPPPPSLKAAVSTSITPLVIFSEYLLTTTVTDKIVYLLFMLCYSLCIFNWLIKKHPDI